MTKPVLLLLIALGALLFSATQFAPAPSYAIDRATPTPGATEFPEELDVEQALEHLLGLLGDAAYDEAILLAGRILEEDAEAWRAHYYRGFARLQQDNLDAALAEYTAVLDIRHWDSTFWRLRGELHLQDKNPRQALADYKQALFHNPRSLQTYRSLSQLHERDVNKTLRDLYRALVDAGQANAQGAVNSALNLLTDEIDSFNRGRLPAELGYAYYSRADIWIEEENWDEALADLSRAIALQPEMQDYYLARGRVYARTERSALAGADFHQRMILLERDAFAAELAYGETLTVAMSPGLVARLSFAGEAGQSVTISARDTLGAGVDPLMALLGVDGAPLSGDDDGGGELDSLISGFELPASGRFTIAVSHANGGHEGEIRVNLR